MRPIRKKMDEINAEAECISNALAWLEEVSGLDETKKALESRMDYLVDQYNDYRQREEDAKIDEEVRRNDMMRGK